jgi:hypothetical protein
MSIVLVGSTSGSITLQEPAIAGTTTINLPATSGTALVAPTALTVPNTTGTVMVSGNMPAFSAVPANSTQTPAASTFTKVTLGTELFDTNSNFASSRFTPTIAGYYQINGTVNMAGSVARLLVTIYKNGSEWNRGFDVNANTLSGTTSQLMYLNGSTDYVELYTFNTSGGVAINGVEAYTCFSGSLVRAA